VYLNSAFWFFWGWAVDIPRQPPSFFGCAPLLYRINFLQLIIFYTSASIICDYLKCDLETNLFLTRYLSLYAYNIASGQNQIFKTVQRLQEMVYLYLFIMLLQII